MVKFRRTTPRARGKKRLIPMLVAVALLLLGVKLLFNQFTNLPRTELIQIVFVERNKYLINGDTTDYDEFASTLLSALKASKQNAENITINMQIPKGKTVVDVADIVQLIQALSYEKVQTNFKIEQ